MGGAGDILNIVQAAVTGYISGGWTGAIIAVVLTFASMALAPKPKKPDSPVFSVTAQDRKQNFRQPITARKTVYGRIQVGGPIVYLQTTKGTGANSQNDTDLNTYLHMVIVVANHEIQEFESFYVNGEQVTPSNLDSSGNVTEASGSIFWHAGDKYTGSYLRIQTGTGANNQLANASLISESGGLWTESHTLSGMAYIYFRFRWDQNLYSAVPNVKAVIKGKKIFDPRDSSTAYSNNSALVLRDYLTSDYGLDVAASKIDDTYVTTAANICDEDLALADGGTENRYESNGMISSESKPREIINELLTAMSGTLSYANALYRMFAASTQTAEYSFNESDVIGELTVQARLSRRDTFNSIKGTFISEETDWEESDYPSLSVESFVGDDNGAVIYRDFTLPFTTSSTMAQRIAKIQLYSARQPVNLQGVFKCTTFNVDINDVIQLSNTRYGWNNKLFRVIAWGFQATPTGLMVKMSLTEYAASSYSWATTEEQAMADAPNTSLPSTFVVGQPTNLAISESLFTTRDNSRVASLMTITWTAASDVQVTEYQVQYKLSTDSVFLTNTVTIGTKAEILDLPAGVYNIRVRSKNSVGMLSTYLTGVFSLSGLSAIPANVTDLQIMTMGGLGIAEWTQSTDLDVTIGGGVEIRWSPAISGATWITSVLVDNTIAGIATSVAVPLRLGTYLAKFFDSSGNYSATAATVVSENETILQYQNTVTVTENPNFTGVKDGTIVQSNVLQLGSAVLLDSVADFDAIANFDLLGNINSTGTYFFANKLDKGSQTRVRLQASTTSSIVNALDLIDSRSANIDTWADFDGNSGQAAVGNIAMYYRTTNNDPNSGSPTWSVYKLFQSSEAYARGFDFKAVLTTSDPAYTIKCTALSVTSNTL